MATASGAPFIVSALLPAPIEYGREGAFSVSVPRWRRRVPFPHGTFAMLRRCDGLVEIARPGAEGNDMLDFDAYRYNSILLVPRPLTLRLAATVSGSIRQFRVRVDFPVSHEDARRDLAGLVMRMSPDRLTADVLASALESMLRELLPFGAISEGSSSAALMNRDFRERALERGGVVILEAGMEAARTGGPLPVLSEPMLPRMVRSTGNELGLQVQWLGCPRSGVFPLIDNQPGGRGLPVCVGTLTSERAWVACAMRQDGRNWSLLPMGVDGACSTLSSGGLPRLGGRWFVWPEGALLEGPENVWTLPTGHFDRVELAVTASSKPLSREGFLSVLDGEGARRCPPDVAMARLSVRGEHQQGNTSDGATCRASWPASMRSILSYPFSRWS